MTDQPNVLMICTDHWPGRLMGAADHPVIQTPTIDQLARNGVRFTNAYTECPICIPARRTLMTGTTPRTHGDRVYTDTMVMPDAPTLAQCFRDAGYQAYAAGKLHVYPQRDRIGFDDVALLEEGRTQFGVLDDYERYLAEQGYAGRLFDQGLCNNGYHVTPWQLPEHCHPTNWTAREMCRFIERRDPTRPGFWYASFCHPHPPLWPLRFYLDMYRDIGVDMPRVGEWARAEDLPDGLAINRELYARTLSEPAVRLARQAFYGLVTHIDHQIRVILGTLREAGLLSNTYILFTCDHGDMLGEHDLYAKAVFYEAAANIPLILSGQGDARVGHHRVDDRICGLQDVMPTLLDACGIDIPDTVEGESLLGEPKRGHLYGEIRNGRVATRMIRRGDYKLIYYPAGNVRQLFDVTRDPHEMCDLSADKAHAATLEEMTNLLVPEMYGEDVKWIQDGRLVGLPAERVEPATDYNFSSQRGMHVWP